MPDSPSTSTRWGKPPSARSTRARSQANSARRPISALAIGRAYKSDAMSVIGVREVRSMDSHERHLHLVDPCDDDYARSQLDLFTPLVDVVGDADTLWRLDTDPLPDEEFHWSAVDPVDKAFVEEVVALSDECCRLVLDVEYQTIVRRILARVAAQDPRPFRRSPHAA